MPLLTGRPTFVRFRVPAGTPAPAFGDDHLALLRTHALGTATAATADGTSAGWLAGGHERDDSFALEKNVVDGCLAMDFCIETERIPGGLLRAYEKIELAAMAKENPSGLPSARQKREAKEIARDRITELGKDERFKKRKCVPVLWDAGRGEVLFGSAIAADGDRFASLFRETFGTGDLEAKTAGWHANYTDLSAAEDEAHDTVVEEGVFPSAFIPGGGEGVAWIPDESSQDYLGNEFLLWLWYTADAGTDTLTLPDGTDCTVMLARTLALECPRGVTGRETIKSEAPTRLPEARRAIQAGKLPRKAGLTLVRHDSQYEFTLQAETMAVGSAKLPAPEEKGRAAAVERVAALRHLCETLDLTYAAFLATRLGPKWAAELERMQRWLSREDRAAA